MDIMLNLDSMIYFIILKKKMIQSEDRQSKTFYKTTIIYII